jgi:hypothetical protein
VHNFNRKRPHHMVVPLILPSETPPCRRRFAIQSRRDTGSDISRTLLQDGVPRLDAVSSGSGPSDAFIEGWSPFQHDDQDLIFAPPLSDAPGFFASYNAPNGGPNNSLNNMSMNDTFRTWVAVQDTTQSTNTFSSNTLTGASRELRRSIARNLPDKE